MSDESEKDEKKVLDLTFVKKRIIRASADIMQDAPKSPEYLHSILCQLGLPRIKTPGRTFSRTNGRNRITIEAGNFYNGREDIQLPLPYGVKPRLALIHITSEAVRTKSLEVDVGDSIHAFMKQLGTDTSGRGYKLFRNQFGNLVAARLRLAMTLGDNRVKNIDVKPIEEFDAWLGSDGHQESFWTGQLKLNPTFYQTLLQHAVPLDSRALQSIKHSALTIDVYTWLAQRLCRVERQGVKLKWTNLKDQFGQEYSDSKNFKKEFKKSLRQALAVYPNANVESLPDGDGILLKPSKPPIAKTKILTFKDD